MFRGRLQTFGSCMLVAGLLASESLQPQGMSQEGAPSVKAFFEELVKGVRSPAPQDSTLLKVADHVAGDSPDDILTALPWIREALAARDDEVKLDGEFVLLMVAYRSDGGELLKNYVKDVCILLESSNPRVEAMAVNILGSIRPRPPSGAVSCLVAFAERSDRDQRSQAGALSFVLGTEPEKAEAKAALRNFLSRPLNSQTREVVLNGIANSHTKDPQLVELLIRALDDPDEGTRFTAAQAFKRMPQEAVRLAQDALRKVMKRPDEAQEVKAAAEESLKSLE